MVRARSGRIPLTVVSLPPNRWHWTQTLAWGDRLSFGFDGNGGWIQDTGGVAPMTPGQATTFQLLFDITAPLKLRSLFPDITIQASDEGGEIRESPTTVLLGRSRDGLEIELAFDTDKGLLRRVGEVALEDYRDVNGVTRPFRLRMGELMVVDFSEIRHDLPVDETLFHKPETGLPSTDPVIYRTHDKTQVSIEELDACVGEYQLPEGPTFSVVRQGEHLMFQAPGSMRFEIFPMSERSYVMHFNHLEFHFLEDETGAVGQLAIGADRTRVATRIR
jgi:hypothetical protein